MQKIKTFLILPVSVIFIMSSCMKKESYPDVPQIEFQNFVKIYDSTEYPSNGIISIAFTDGDGDIGLAKGDTFAPFNKEGDYYYNFILDYYEKVNGEFVKVTFPGVTFNSRIPVLNPTDPGRAIRGIIDEKILLNPFPAHDTIKFEAFIYDRALNKSNVISTPEIILRRP